MSRPPELHPVDIEVEADAACLAGAVWMPSAPRGLVLMVPGSGPSTRHNDSYFPPIRRRLLDAGYGVASFDKRGVGQSTGTLTDTTIERQAADARCCVDRLRQLRPTLPIAVFGHSQGGWVAVEVAASDRSIVACVANAGPTVDVATQERYRMLGSAEHDPNDAAHHAYDLLLAVARRHGSFDDAIAAVDGIAELREEFADVEEYWPLLASILTYDPAATLERITCPTLCIYGSRDRVVPVAACVRILEHVRSELIDVAVLPGGDHRVQVGDDFVAGYFELLVGFLDTAAGPLAG